MKLKLNTLHKIALAALAVGIGLLIFGMVVLFRYANMRDISELKFDEIKSGTYVRGTVKGVVLGYHDGLEVSEPLTLYTTDSNETADDAYMSYFLIELKNDKGKYVCILIDEFRDTDLYFQLFDQRTIEQEEEFEVEGIIKYSKSNEEMIKSKVKEFEDTYPFIYFEHHAVDGFSAENVSPCYIEVRPLGARRLWWLYCIPFLFAGVALMILGGRPYERTK